MYCSRRFRLENAKITKKCQEKNVKKIAQAEKMQKTSAMEK